ncbi:MAG: rsmG [Deltaproteobacteria bacterium]|nr:rsmG [Deltaproteobacteria bacterium]
MDHKRLIKDSLDHFHIPLSEEELAKLVRFIEELARWNRTVNLVGIKNVDRVCAELLADSFFVYTFIIDGKRVIDLGSGSGIAGIPFAILNRSLEICSVDSNLKKIQFQRHIRRSLGILNFLPIWGRVEAIDPLKGDRLVAKAYGTSEAILAAADRHLIKGGLVYIVKGKAENEVSREGYSIEKSVDYSLPGVTKGYRLLIYKKIS